MAEEAVSTARVSDAVVHYVEIAIPSFLPVLD